MGNNVQEQFNELSFYTLSHKSGDFIHQHAVDALTAQCADESTKPITVYFALAGLFLHLEKGYSGKQVKNAHMLFSKKTKSYPAIMLPEYRGAINVSHVLNAGPGPDRDKLVEEWCRCVWNAYQQEHEKIILFTNELLK